MTWSSYKESSVSKTQKWSEKNATKMRLVLKRSEREREREGGGERALVFLEREKRERKSLAQQNAFTNFNRSKRQTISCRKLMKYPDAMPVLFLSPKITTSI